MKCPNCFQDLKEAGRSGTLSTAKGSIKLLTAYYRCRECQLTAEMKYRWPSPEEPTP